MRDGNQMETTMPCKDNFFFLLQTEILTMVCLIVTMQSHLMKRNIYLHNVRNSKKMFDFLFHLK